MNMSRCENGHLYNPKKYEQCPYCDAGVLKENKNSQQSRPEQPQSNNAPTGNEPSGGKTLAYWDGQDGANPVVGWIVCIEGMERGKDYQIKSERNFIGRSEDMHISIAGDQKISRRNHAIISYNPKERNFVMIPGADTTGIVYINGEAIYSATELAPYDVIEMGKSKFIFIPLCGQHFEWENEV
ncbi:MAG: FHA domain-containing protein [Bacillota bacterium]